MDDLNLDKDYKRGSKGAKVKLIQEWLTLHGPAITIDGDFGPATERAVKAFQQKQRIAVDGVVGQETFGRLIKPMVSALKPISPGGRSLGQMVVAYAEQHLAQGPREVGGENRGPWVRLYLDGNQGKDWAWCAGFVCFILKSACASLGKELPLTSSFSCTTLAANATAKGIFLNGASPGVRSKLTPGLFFLLRRGTGAWKHVGIVIVVGPAAFDTIEGNTNVAGSSEGDKVHRRTRAYEKTDFVLV